MRSLMLMDAVFAGRELGMLQRLAVGLTQEQVQVLVGVPAGCEVAARLGLMEEPLVFHAGGLSLTLPLRAAHLASGVVRRAGEAGVSVVHAFGERVWGLACGVGRALDVPVVFDVWRQGAVTRARSIALREAGRVTVLAADPAIERALLRDGAGPTVRPGPWGVYVPGDSSLTPGRVLRPASGERAAPIAVAVLGSGLDRSSAVAAFTGLARLARQRQELMLFIDQEAARNAELWRLGGRLGVRERLTVVEHSEAARQLVLRCDLVLHPDRRGELRTVLLDAMAAGVPVIAAADPTLGVLIDGRTARLVDGSSAEAWAAAIEALLADPAPAVALASSARAYLREHRRVSSQVAAVIDAYEQAVEQARAGERTVRA